MPCCTAAAALVEQVADTTTTTGTVTKRTNTADELSVNHATVVAPYSKQSSFSTLKRDSSSKTLFAYFTGDNTNKESGVNRSSSRRKLMSRRSSQMSSSPNNNPEADGGAMFPINEIDSRLDPDTMFLNQNFSNKSLGDNQDYSRKLKITNLSNSITLFIHHTRICHRFISHVKAVAEQQD